MKRINTKVFLLLPMILISLTACSKDNFKPIKVSPSISRPEKVTALTFEFKGEIGSYETSNEEDIRIYSTLDMILEKSTFYFGPVMIGGWLDENDPRTNDSVIIQGYDDPNDFVSMFFYDDSGPIGNYIDFKKAAYCYSVGNTDNLIRYHDLKLYGVYFDEDLHAELETKFEEVKTRLVTK